MDETDLNQNSTSFLDLDCQREMHTIGENDDNNIGCKGVPCFNEIPLENGKPYVGLEFSCIEDADMFYKEYGRSKGFSTCKRSSYATAREDV